MAYTVQKCKGCGVDVKIEALGFLMNLGNAVLCKDCEAGKKPEV